MKKISKEKREMIIRRTLYFGLPLIIMAIIYAILHVYPFGKLSLLTYDMGEQYVDFFAFYKDTLLHHPSQLLYSFTNGIGGETLGLWAYYLLSPFNLILLFFPKSMLPVGIMIMTLIKYGCAGLALGYCLEKMHWTDQKWIPAATVCYALMGWILANEFNIMWLDVLVLLPFTLYGIEKIFDEDRSFYYTIFLALTLFINFYMGYMVCIFVVLYFIWTAVRKWQNWKTFGKKAARFSISSLLAAGSVAFLLLPTYFDITKSKGVYTQQTIQSVIEYQPWKMLSKFMIGTINDNQIQNGFPNLFVGALIIGGFILYFLAKKIPWREKITAGLVCVFMFFAMCWQPLDLVWHAFQYPVYYPYRFSYLVSTWMILLALRGFAKVGKPKIYQLAITFIIPVICWIVIFINRKKFNFLTVPNAIATLIFWIVIFGIMIWMLMGWNKQIKKFNLQMLASGLMLVLIAAECGMNGYQTIKNIPGASEVSYTNFVANLDRDIAWINNQDNGHTFYRIGKTFQRSENDSLNAGYRGLSGFTSTQNAAVTSFMNSMGQPNYLGKENYTEGTLLTDSVMGAKYFLAPTDQFDNLVKNNNWVTPATSYRPDISFYGPVKRINGVTIYQNPLALSVGFAATKDVLSSKNNFPSSDFTADNQSYLLNTIAGTHRQYFDKVGYYTKMTNCTLDGGANGNLITTDPNQPSTYEIQLKNVGAEPYYIQLTTGIVWNSSITINGNSMPGMGNGSQPTLFNVSANTPGQDVTIDINPNNGKTIDLNDLEVYKFNLSAFEKTIYSVMNNQWNLTHNGRLQLRGNIDIPHDKDVMMTTIPFNKGWSAKVDGQKVKPREAFGTFLAIPMTPGRHHVTLSFWPPLLTPGIIVTLITWAILVLCWRYEKKK